MKAFGEGCLIALGCMMLGQLLVSCVEGPKGLDTSKRPETTQVTSTDQTTSASTSDQSTTSKSTSITQAPGSTVILSDVDSRGQRVNPDASASNTWGWGQGGAIHEIVAPLLLSTLGVWALYSRRNHRKALAIVMDAIEAADARLTKSFVFDSTLVENPKSPETRLTRPGKIIHRYANYLNNARNDGEGKT